MQNPIQFLDIFISLIINGLYKEKGGQALSVSWQFKGFTYGCFVACNRQTRLPQNCTKAIFLTHAIGGNGQPPGRCLDHQGSRRHGFHGRQYQWRLWKHCKMP